MGPRPPPSPPASPPPAAPDPRPYLGLSSGGSGACREGMRSLGGFLPLLPPASEGWASPRCRTEGLPRSEPRGLPAPPRRAGPLLGGSESWRRAAGECWKASSCSSSSSGMEGRGFSGLAPPSGRGCGYGGMSGPVSVAPCPPPKSLPAPPVPAALREARGAGEAAGPLRERERTEPGGGEQPRAAPRALNVPTSARKPPPGLSVPPEIPSPEQRSLQQPAGGGTPGGTGPSSAAPGALRVPSQSCKDRQAPFASTGVYLHLSQALGLGFRI